MCYSIVLSTKCADDLRLVANSESLDLTLVSEVKYAKPALTSMPYSHNWDINRTGMCTCYFWIESPSESETDDFVGSFDRDSDWCPVRWDEGDLAATAEIYALLRNLHNQGFDVAIFCDWEDESSEDASEASFRLSELPQDRFRLYEGCLIRVGA